MIKFAAFFVITRVRCSQSIHITAPRVTTFTGVLRRPPWHFSLLLTAAILSLTEKYYSILYIQSVWELHRRAQADLIIDTDNEWARSEIFVYVSFKNWAEQLHNRDSNNHFLRKTHSFRTNLRGVEARMCNVPLTRAHSNVGYRISDG